MVETIEQCQDPVPADSPVPEISQPESPSSDEGVLTSQIVELWQVHENHQTSIKHETEQFRALRDELGKLLHQMKELLARPGRSGQWSALLKERAIPRATADRLVHKYERSLNPNANCLTEQLAEPTEEEIQRAFVKVFPKLRRVLRTPASAYRFVDLLSGSFEGLERRVTEEGFVVLRPAQHTAAVESVPAESQVEAAPLIADTVVEASSILCEPLMYGCCDIRGAGPTHPPCRP